MNQGVTNQRFVANFAFLGFVQAQCKQNLINLKPQVKNWPVDNVTLISWDFCAIG